MRSEPGFVSDSEVESILEESEELRDDLDIYEKMFEEQVYATEIAPDPLINHLKHRGYTGQKEDSREAMRWFACEIALTASELEDELESLSQKLVSNGDYERVQELGYAHHVVEKAKRTGVEDSLTYAVSADLPNEGYSPGRIYAEQNEIKEKQALSAVADNFEFSN
jgi:hypothetical protein